MDSPRVGDDTGENERDWTHHFVAGYSCHTANFISAQVLVWSRVLFLVGFDVMYISDWVSGAVLLTGLALSVPYTLSIFRRSELVVDGGPSLINGLIPEWLTTFALLCISIFLGIADVSSRWNSLSLSWLMYLLAAMGALVFGVLSKYNHKERVLVSSAALMISMYLPSEYSGQAIRIVPTLTLTVSYVFDALYFKSNRSVLGTSELTTFRYRMLAKLALAACMLFRLNRFLTLPVAFSLIGCDFALYFAERRLGPVQERQFLRNLPQRRVQLQVTD